MLGRRLGRYEIVAPLGAGGMGEVYRARDTRLDREVAVKILPASVATDPERLARFERETRAVAALTHPNILALHDAGTEDGVTFAVMELLDGQTLRERLTDGPMPVRRAIDAAIQIARGLTAAHAKGLVHRDLKPENVFLVADGQVKILDFGLAKTADPDSAAATMTQAALMTDPGTVLGTVGYMAPEQVRGQATDARADLFALGALLYEMVTGERAFRRDTAAETMTAILREEPPDLPAPQTAQAPALDRIIRHCLEKNPGERFQSARDVAFALEALSSTSGATSATGAPGATRAVGAAGAASRRMSVMSLAPAILVIAAIAVAWALGYVRVGPADAASGIANISYRPVTFDEGFVFGARFARDGRTIIYSADWENQPRDLFVTSIDGYGSRALGYKNADLLSVSPDGALAILMDSIVPYGNPYSRTGTIARASLTGGAPRRELDRVSFADFAADGSLAVSRWTGEDKGTIEWPQGRAIVTADRTENQSALPNPRVSPSGSHIAFFACDVAACTVRIANATGQTVAETPRYADWWGLAWAPGGREVWCAVAETAGRQVAVFALDLNGRQRPLYRSPGAMTLHDVSADGKMLAAFDQVINRIEQRATPDAAPRDLSWKEGGYIADVSANGVVLFWEDGDSGGPAGSVYVRRTADPEPVRISDGAAIAISPDGTTALVRTRARPIGLSLVPTTGLAQALDVGAFDAIETGGWLADGRLVLELRRKAGEPTSVLARPAGGGSLVPFLPDGYVLDGPRGFAPDGRHVVAADRDSRLVMCSVPSSGLASCAAMPGMTKQDRIAGWTADSRSILVYRPYPVPVAVERMSIDTGRREPVTILHPATAAVSGLRALMITPDGVMVYNYARNRSALYVLSGLK